MNQSVFIKTILILLAGFVFQSCGRENDRRPLSPATIDDRVLVSASNFPGDWLNHGLDYAETRYSPLGQINSGNVDRLGLAWTLDLGTKRGIEATPIVVDGIMYASGPWSDVYAIDARDGRMIWNWDAEVPGEYGDKACCDVVNRGVAVYRGKVFVGTLDGRIAAIDAGTGETVWENLTVDPEDFHTITGAPRIVKGKVIIGNGGAEFGVRGYVSAYNAETGEMVWRTYTVPGDPSLPFESEAMEKAAETWNGEWWKYGGGGTAWDSFAYDPKLNLLYVGTGNGSPWNRHIRSPGGGDNLFLSSILALNPDNGAYVWHYQTTPGDSWDFTATQHMILADLELNGELRQVIMQAPKNGFFFVLDRQTGEFLSGEPYVEVTWATGIDQETGRPMEAPGADYKYAPMTISPAVWGGHNWHPMSYNPDTGLVYIPATLRTATYSQDENFVRRTDGPYNFGAKALGAAPSTGHLLAWDPVRQKEAWRVPHAIDWNGGTMTTAGNLVFQGTGDARFMAFNAATGETLWEMFAGTGIIGSPVTYLVDGVQYVTILAGWGGAYGLTLSPGGEAVNYQQVGRVYTFKLDGSAPMPEFAVSDRQKPEVTEQQRPSPQLAIQGAALYKEYCQKCHGGNAVSYGVLPDLRYSAIVPTEAFHTTVLDGILLPLGMPRYDDRLDREQVNLIQAFLLSRIFELKEER
ncbi:MAG: PQQ-dependent dehydrogenase, methanol/ethanol family [Opitutae bacterium]|nr:PQQ-dependent dehydrogenase, methanol/ethanol family [Opitutae bacterium]